MNASLHKFLLDKYHETKPIVFDLKTRSNDKQISRSNDKQISKAKIIRNSILPKSNIK
jgi:hypothetical protein